MYKHVQKSRNQRKADMVFVMGGRCQVCGYDTCNNALDFHHIDPKTKCVNLTKSTSYHGTELMQSSKNVHCYVPIVIENCMPG